MQDHLHIAVAQLNPRVGDLAANVAALKIARNTAAAEGADLVVAAELAVSGYPPGDLLLRPAFEAACRREVEALAAITGDGGPAMLVGCPWRVGGKLYNAALLLDGGAISGIRLKTELPNYGVFDEKRLFHEASPQGPLLFRGIRIGVMICEDIWAEDAPECLAGTGAEFFIVINGSPYEIGKHEQRLSHARRCQDWSARPLLYINQTGGQDELVFDGQSFVLDSEGNEVVRLPAFTEALITTEWRRGDEGWICLTESLTPSLESYHELYCALMMGLSDYVGKNNFPGVLLGLSGGVDSALTAAIAVDALGPERVWGVMLPSPYTSEDSTMYAAACAKALGIRYDVIPITEAKAVFERGLTPFSPPDSGVMYENLQSRIRGVFLMALSNGFGSMLLATGNKSEFAVGYATLYGDMCGGYAVLKDVYKTNVYRLANWRNRAVPLSARGRGGNVIPEGIIRRAPTAELKPNQTDQDSLPPYDILDAILFGLIEKEESQDDLIAAGFESATVRKVGEMLYRAEYKRRQGPPGVKVTARLLGQDRRYPITNGFIESSIREIA